MTRRLPIQALVLLALAVATGCRNMHPPPPLVNVAPDHPQARGHRLVAGVTDDTSESAYVNSVIGSYTYVGMLEPDLNRVMEEAAPPRALYRLGWLPSFRAPIVIRVHVYQRGDGVLIIKRGSTYSYHPNMRLSDYRSRHLTRREIAEIRRRVDAILALDPPVWGEHRGIDGNQTILEAHDGRRLRRVSRWNADSEASELNTRVMDLQTHLLAYLPQDFDSIIHMGRVHPNAVKYNELLGDDYADDDDDDDLSDVFGDDDDDDDDDDDAAKP